MKLDQPGRHRLRIQAKKLRYAAEFFATVFFGKGASKLRKAFLSALEDMQDCLGELFLVHAAAALDLEALGLLV